MTSVEIRCGDTGGSYPLQLQDLQLLHHVEMVTTLMEAVGLNPHKNKRVFALRVLARLRAMPRAEGSVSAGMIAWVLQAPDRALSSAGGVIFGSYLSRERGPRGAVT